VLIVVAFIVFVVITPSEIVVPPPSDIVMIPVNDLSIVVYPGKFFDIITFKISKGYNIMQNNKMLGL
jgi:hypothetical protein